MDTRHGHGTASGFLHRHFFWLLVGTYALAGVAPAAGCRLSGLDEVGTVFGRAVRVSAPAMMLGVLLFAAGFAVRGEYLRGVYRPLALAGPQGAHLGAPTRREVASDPRKLAQTLEGHNGLVRSLALSPDDKWLVTAGRDGKLLVWDFAAGKVKASVDEGVTGFQVVAFSPDGKTLATGGTDRKVTQWDFERLLKDHAVE